MKAIVGVWDDRGLSVFLDRLRTIGGFDVVPAGRAVGVKEIEGSGLVVMNLRPYTGAVEDIDLSGTALLRAAAKRFAAVGVVVDPDDYPWVATALTGGGLSLDQRRMLAHKAFQHVSAYDASVAASLRGPEDPSDPTLGPDLVIGLRRLQSLRYGENPHQKSAFYQELPARGGVIATAKQLHGKELPTTTSSTPTRRGPLPATSRSRPSPSSSTPTPAAWRRAAIRRRPTGSPSPATPSPHSAGSSPATAS